MNFTPHSNTSAVKARLTVVTEYSFLIRSYRLTAHYTWVFTFQSELVSSLEVTNSQRTHIPDQFQRLHFIRVYTQDGLLVDISFENFLIRLERYLTRCRQHCGPGKNDDSRPYSRFRGDCRMLTGLFRIDLSGMMQGLL